MTGSLQVKKDIYYMVINLYGADGKRKPKWICTNLPTKGNKKRADKMLRETLLQYELEANRQPDSNIPFIDWLRHWLYDVSKARVDIVTFEGYEMTAKSQIFPDFEASGTLLSEIDLHFLYLLWESPSFIISKKSLNFIVDTVHLSCYN